MCCVSHTHSYSLVTVMTVILKQEKSQSLALFPTCTTLVRRMINVSQNKEPVSNYNSILWNTSCIDGSLQLISSFLHPNIEPRNLELVQNNLQPKFPSSNYTHLGQELVYLYTCRPVYPWPRWWLRAADGWSALTCITTRPGSTRFCANTLLHSTLWNWKERH